MSYHFVGKDLHKFAEMAIQVVMIGFCSFEVSGAISLQLWQVYQVFCIDVFMPGQCTNTLAKQSCL